jgi:hypothetical protein
MKHISLISVQLLGDVLNPEKIAIRRRGQHRRELTILLTTSLLLLFAAACHAKAWDFDRGQYRSDAEIAGLAGPVREVTERDSQGGKVSYISKRSFDQSENLILDTFTSYSNEVCAENIYTYDTSGNRLTASDSAVQIAPGSVSCPSLKLQSSDAYSYKFNTRGEMTMQTMISSLPAFKPVVSEYSYDDAGHMVRMDETSGSGSMYEALSYATDPHGMQVTRHHYSSNNGLVLDVVRTLIYSADGRLLQLTQVPSDVFGFGGGDQVLVYSDTGRLAREQSGKYSISYSQHDHYGNWTESLDSNGNGVRLEIEYNANSQ